MLEDEAANLLDLVRFGFVPVRLKVDNLIYPCFREDMVISLDPHVETESFDEPDQLGKAGVGIAATRENGCEYLLVVAHLVP